MFKRTYRHIYFILMLTATLLIAAFIFLSAIMVNTIMAETYITMPRQKLDVETKF